MHMKNCLTSLSQIKTTMKYLFTPTGMAKIKKKGSSIGEDVEKLEPSETVGGNVSWCSHFEEQASSFSKMLKHRVAIWPSNSSFWQIPKRTENRQPHRNVYVTVHSSIIHNSQTVKQQKMSINWWMDWEYVVYLCNGMLWNLKKEWSAHAWYKMAEPWKHKAKWK